MTSNIIQTEVELAVKARLTDADVERIVRRGDAEFFRSVAMKVRGRRLSRSRAVGLIVARARPAILADLFLMAVALPLKAARRVIQ